MDYDDVLIDDIYAAAALPGLWKDVLARIAKVTDARDALLQGALYRDGLIHPAFLLATQIKPSDIQHHAEIVAQAGEPRLAATVEARVGSMLQDLEWISPEEMEKHPYYQELLVPLDMWFCSLVAGVKDPGPNGTLLVGFSVQFARKQGPLEGERLVRWTRVSKHLVRAMRLAFRLNTLSEAGPVLLRPNRALFTLDHLGRVIGFNALAEVMMADGEATLDDLERLVFRDPVLHAHVLRLLLGELGGRRNSPLTGSLRTPRGTWVYSARPLPRPRVLTRGGRSTPCIELEISRESASSQPEILSPAESRLVAHLADGTALKHAAERLNISYETARSHCKRAMQKFGVNSQAALVIEWMKARGRLRQD